MAKIDLEAQAQAILNRERNGSKQFDVIVGNLMAMDSFLSTYKTLKSKGKLKGKKLEKVKALVEKVQAIRDHINDTIYKEQNRRKLQLSVAVHHQVRYRKGLLVDMFHIGSFPGQLFASPTVRVAVYCLPER